jgi:hypothetical protein
MVNKVQVETLSARPISRNTMSNATPRYATVDANKMIITDGNHGGYRTGFCAVCEASGWLDVPKGASNGIVHKPDCVVGIALSALQEMKVLDLVKMSNLTYSLPSNNFANQPFIMADALKRSDLEMVMSCRDFDRIEADQEHTVLIWYKQ